MEENTVPVTIRFSEDFFSGLKSEAFEKKESVATIVYNRLLYSYKQNSIQDKLDNIERKMEELILKQDGTRDYFAELVRLSQGDLSKVKKNILLEFLE